MIVRKAARKSGFALLHVESPYWVALTAAAALQGTSPRHSRRRALERAAGTAFGAILAAVLLALDPSAGAVVVAIAVLQVLTELAIVASYGAGCVLLTPIPLLQLHLVAPTHAAAGFVIAFGNFEGTFYRYAKRYEQAQNWSLPKSEPLHKP